MNAVVQETVLANYDAEQAYLGACLANNEVWHLLADELQPEHFADALHARVYEAIGKLISSGIRADIVTLKKQFDQDGALQAIGGAKYLVQLAASVVTVLGAKDYGRAVIEMWRRRQIRTAASEAIQQTETFVPGQSASDVLESLEARLSDIASSGTQEKAVITVAAAAGRAVERAAAAVKHGGSMGVCGGLTDLDRILGGFQKPDLVILAGRPSMGKTALATNICFNASLNGHRVAAFSLEMSAEQLGQRVISMKTGITVDRQRSGFATGPEIEAMMEATHSLQDVPLWIDDDPTLSVQGMTAMARRIKRQVGLDLVVVDHLGRIKTARGEKSGGLYERTTTIVRDCKSMAKVLDVPVLLLVQLSRSVEMREDKRPQLSDLRDSGAIEEEADVVMFIYRDEYYLERTEPKAGSENYDARKRAWDVRMMNAHNIAEVIVAKNRQGPIRSTKIRFDGARQLFQDLQV